MDSVMQNEFLRISSFAKAAGNIPVCVTQLAHSGFYCVNDTGRVRCFGCGREYRNYLHGSPVENAHDRRCHWHNVNKPLRCGTRGIDQQMLETYFNNEYEHTTGNVRNDFQHRGNGDGESFIEDYDDEDETDSGGNATRSQAFGIGSGSNVGTRDLRPNASRNSLGAPHSGQAFADVPEAQNMQEFRPQYHSEPFANVPNEAIPNSESSTHPPSLPQNLNQFSSPVVIQEGSVTTTSTLVLTSATRRPYSLESFPGQGRGHEASRGASPTLHFDLSKASYPQFAAVQARRMTFANWQPDHSHRPVDLADAGFFYAGYADCVRCFYCGLGLKYWREEDIPEYQHARFRPACVYNRMYKGQEYIDRVQQELLLGQEVSSQTTNQRSEMSTTTTTTNQPSIPSETQESVTMRSEAAQAALRLGWTRDQVRQGVENILQILGQDSLQFDVLQDVLTSFNRARNTSNSSDDENGDSDSASDYDETDNVVDNVPVAAVRVATTPESVQAGTGQNGGASDETMASSQVQQPAARQPDPNEQFRCVEREHTYLKQRTTCSVCRGRPVHCVYLPCGHVTACQQCGDEASTCILCGKVIIGTANVYFA